jgi:flagellar basal-body rod modification protein FlgD
MSTVSSLSPATQVTQPKSDFTKASLSYDSFLKLLLQQLKSQDPTSPVDQKETLAQLASFSNVEQSIKLNQKLDSLLGQQRIVEASALVGKHIRSVTANMEGTVTSVSLLQGKLTATLDNGNTFDVTGDIEIST